MRSALRSHAGETDFDVVVVDSGSTDETGELAEALGARVVRRPNRGFAYANNRGLEAVSAEWVFFLNPDTEVVEGTLSDLVEAAQAHAKLGIARVRQVGSAGFPEWSIRRSPSALRWLGEAVGSEALPWRTRWSSGERVLDAAAYAQERQIDWTSGSCMLARSAMLRQIGGMDEQFFLQQETDLCRRARNAGWEVWHLPVLTIVHYGGNEQSDPRLAAQLVHSRRLYLRKHGTRIDRVLGFLVLVLGQAVRSALDGHPERRRGARAALQTLWGFARRPSRH